MNSTAGPSFRVSKVDPRPQNAQHSKSDRQVDSQLTQITCITLECVAYKLLIVWYAN